MDFHFDIVHKPGDMNIADYMSRQPTKNDESDDSHGAERYMHFILTNAVPMAMTRGELIEFTNQDQVLQALQKLIYRRELNQDEQLLVKIICVMVMNFQLQVMV
jgi:hypothetical protein